MTGTARHKPEEGEQTIHELADMSSRAGKQLAVGTCCPPP